MNEKLPPRVNLREVGPRDGLQSIPDFVATEQKLTVIRAAADAGLREIEVTSFVSERFIPQIKDAPEIMAATADLGVKRTVLAPTFKHAQAALAAGADQIAVFVSASEGHNQANVRRSIDESMAGIEAIIEAAGRDDTPVIGGIAVSFGCPYEGDVALEQVLGIAQRYRSAGAAGVVFGDTVGMAVPPAVGELVKSYQDRFGANDFSLHFHNNRGMAMANLYAGLCAGAETFDTALGGVGGCPTVPQAAGNLATEDVVCLLDNMGIDCGVDLPSAISAADLLEEILGTRLPGQVMKSGPIDHGPQGLSEPSAKIPVYLAGD